MQSLTSKSPTNLAAGLFRTEGGITFGALGNSALSQENDLQLHLSQSPGKAVRTTPTRTPTRTKASPVTTAVEASMGLLRNGKQYSPTRHNIAQKPPKGGTPMRPNSSPYQRPEDGEIKRKLRNSSSDEHTFLEPSPKITRHHSRTGSSPASLGEVSPSLAPAKVVKTVNMDEFMVRMEKMMKQTVETAVQKSMQAAMVEMKAENSKALEAMQSAVDAHGTSITAVENEVSSVKRALADHERNSTSTHEGIDRRLSEQAKKLDDAVKDIHTRLGKIEQLNDKINDKINAVRDTSSTATYPHEHSIMMHRVAIQQGRDSAGMAKLIIHDVLRLVEVKIVRAKLARKFKNGKHTIKVQLDSAASVLKVLQNKSKLNRAPGDDLKQIWIKQDKPNHQRIAEYNYGVLLDAFQLGEKYRQDSAGRLMLNVNTNESAVEQPNDGSDWDGGTPGGNGPNRVGHVVRGRKSNRRPRGGGRRGATGRGAVQVDSGQPPPRSPVHVDPDVLNAFRIPTSPAQRAENSSDGPSSPMETTSALNHE